jgi:short-subunit dehydrogenase
MNTKLHSGTALITGAASGIGAAYADRLARRGHDLVLVDRDRDRLCSLASGITDYTGRSVEVLTADIGTGKGLRSVERVLATDASLTMLVNNAGRASSAPLLTSDPDELERMINLDVTALMRLASAACPAFAQRGHGTLINVASIAALTPEQLNGVYVGVNAFVLALSQSLHSELSPKGIRVQVVLPGATPTEFRRPGGISVERLPSRMVMSITTMVDAALAGLDLGEIVTIPSLPDVAQWDVYEAARQAMRGKLSRAEPAARYRREADGSLRAP